VTHDLGRYWVPDTPWALLASASFYLVGSSLVQVSRDTPQHSTSFNNRFIDVFCASRMGGVQEALLGLGGLDVDPRSHRRRQYDARNTRPNQHNLRRARVQVSDRRLTRPGHHSEI
jgi:hypothetical protein